MGRFPLFTSDISDLSLPSPSMPTALRQFEIITSGGETPGTWNFPMGLNKVSHRELLTNGVESQGIAS